MGLTSGLARWLMSWAASHALAAGLCRERGAQGRAWTCVSIGPLLKPGSSPSRDLAKARTLLRGTWGLPEGLGMPSWELRACMLRVRCPTVEVRTQ
jgi:hypothetical protein